MDPAFAGMTCEGRPARVSRMSADPVKPIIPVILSGGSGTRLWPLSRRARPKQMLDLAGGGTMLALTVARVADAGPVRAARPGRGHRPGRGGGAGACRQAGVLILEPEARNTAPAIALAALTAAPDDLLLVLPSDHLVGDPAGFRDAVRRARPFAEDGWIVTFGMKAERGETGYRLYRARRRSGRGRPPGGALRREARRRHRRPLRRRAGATTGMPASS